MKFTKLILESQWICSRLRIFGREGGNCEGRGGGNLEAGKGFVFVAVIIAIIILFSLLMVNSSTQV